MKSIRKQYPLLVVENIVGMILCQLGFNIEEFSDFETSVSKLARSSVDVKK